MAKFTAVIKDPVGLHARPASVTVAAASKFESAVSISANGKSGNLKSIMNVMSLGVKQGDQVTIEANGSDADEAVKAIQLAMENHNLI